jgi:hypothetical protein
LGQNPETELCEMAAGDDAEGWWDGVLLLVQPFG